MVLLKLAGLSLRHYWKTSLLIGLSSALCALVLSGALGAGHSIQASLLADLDRRIGPIQFKFQSSDRVFRADLDRRMGVTFPERAIASALYLRCNLSKGERRLPSAKILGIGPPSGNARAIFPAGPAPGEAWISPNCAVQLNASEGDGLICRVNAPGLSPLGLPMGGEIAKPIALTLKIHSVTSRFPIEFNTGMDQNSDPVIVVDRGWLARQVSLDGKANLLLAGPGKEPANAIVSAIRAAWTLSDAGFSLEKLPGRLELVSDRVFIEDRISDSIAAQIPESSLVYTWFADGLTRVEPPATPVNGSMSGASYFFIGSGDAPFLKAPPSAEGIILTDWLAGTLKSHIGDRVGLDFRLPEPNGAFSSHREFFRVEGIVPVPDRADARAMMPKIPGMAQSESCRDWDPSLSIDLSRISESDEAYWRRFGGTPQAYIQLATSRRLFKHPYGTTTSIRFTDSDPALLEKMLSRAITPETEGFQLEDVREKGLSATLRGVDFGGLFIGLNSLLMGAGFILGIMVLDLALQRRKTEFQTYGACGWPPSRSRLLVLLEYLLIGFPCAFAGAVLGLAYNALTIAVLNHVWDGIGAIHLRFLWDLPSALVSVAVTLCGQSALALMRVNKLNQKSPVPIAGRRGLSWAIFAALAAACALGACLIAAMTAYRVVTQPVAGFFGAGFLFLAASVFALRACLVSPLFGKVGGAWHRLLLRNLHFRRRRVILSFTLLVSGIYLVLGIGGYMPPPANQDDPRSPTGGFAWVLRATTPLSRGELGQLSDWQPVAIRLHQGDDASCLNFRRSDEPPIYGVDPAAMRGHFSLIGGKGDPWQTLEKVYPDNAIPVLVDGAVLDWGIGKSVGDHLMSMSENGDPVKLVIAGALNDTVLQGAVMMSESNYHRLFPSEAGYQLCLLGKKGDPFMKKELERRWRVNGLTMESPSERLAKLQGIERSYLSIFLVLGSIALALASLGFAIQVVRSAQEEAQAAHTLSCLGWNRFRIQLFVWGEHFLTWTLGFICGLSSAWLALQGQAAVVDWQLWWAAAGIIFGIGALTLLGVALTLRQIRPEPEL